MLFHFLPGSAVSTRSRTEAEATAGFLAQLANILFSVSLEVAR